VDLSPSSECSAEEFWISCSLVLYLLLKSEVTAHNLNILKPLIDGKNEAMLK